MSWDSYSSGPVQQSAAGRSLFSDPQSSLMERQPATKTDEVTASRISVKPEEEITTNAVEMADSSAFFVLPAVFPPPPPAPPNRIVLSQDLNGDNQSGIPVTAKATLRPKLTGTAPSTAPSDGDVLGEISHRFEQISHRVGRLFVNDGASPLPGGAVPRTDEPAPPMSLGEISHRVKTLFDTDGSTTPGSGGSVPRADEELPSAHTAMKQGNGGGGADKEDLRV